MKRIPKATESAAVRLLRKGVSHRAVAKDLGISVGVVSTIRNRNGIMNKTDLKGFNKFVRRTRVTTNNVLVVGDLHAPFIREGYLEFCVAQYKKYKCNKVVFTGDIVDNHASSFHTSDPDGHSARKELDMAIEQLAKWVKAFPVASVCIGNHDRLPLRKAFESGVSTKWVRDFSEVLGCPDWTFDTAFEIDGVRYEHGEGRKPHIKMKDNHQSIVCGHVHSKLEIQWHVTSSNRIFSMQLGWGGDQSAYALAYAKNFAKGIVSCGVVLDNGTMPITIPMLLMDDEK